MKYEYNKIHIACDTNVVINLAKIDQALFDLHLPVKEHYTDAEKEMIIKSANAYLKGKETDGQYQLGFKDNGYFNFLLYFNYLVNGSKQVVAYIPPTVFSELFLENTIRTHYLSDKIKNYIKKTYKIIKFGEDETEYPQEIIDLANEYVKHNIFEEVAVAPLQKTVPNNDAFIAAECAYAGLNLLSENIKDFIHRDIDNISFNYRELIEKINEQFGLAQSPIEDGIKVPGKVIPSVYSTLEFYNAIKDGTYRQCEPNLSAPYNFVASRKKSNKAVKPGHYRKHKVGEMYKAINYLFTRPLAARKNKQQQNSEQNPANKQKKKHKRR